MACCWSRLDSGIGSARSPEPERGLWLRPRLLRWCRVSGLARFLLWKLPAAAEVELVLVFLPSVGREKLWEYSVASDYFLLSVSPNRVARKEKTHLLLVCLFVFLLFVLTVSLPQEQMLEMLEAHQRRPGKEGKSRPIWSADWITHKNKSFILHRWQFFLNLKIK